MSLRDEFIQGRGCPVIDSHGHLGPFRGIYLPEAAVESMIAGMDRAGVESIILSPHNALEGDTREGNREMLDAVRRYPGRIYGYCTLNPQFPNDLDEEMAACLGQPGVVGIKIHPSMHGVPVGDPRYRPVWERANRDRLMVLSHTWGESGGCGHKDLRPIAEQYPDVRLLLGHSCYGAYPGAIALAAEFPNVYLELTAAAHAYGLIEWMCRDAGSHKVLFGTDYPWFDHAVYIGFVVFAHVDEADMRNILYDNARRLLDEQVARTQS
ncbi:MAG: amidohydrolase [Candidatus Hydrogenedentes bacterium]|nr:amidohydrolase [Candidatus Hydrogenedentota bacterium]